MQQASSAELALVDAIDPAVMLRQVETWSALNTGTGNLAGLAEQSRLIGDAVAGLPGELQMEEPALVTAIAADGTEIEQPHAPHLLISVRPDADRRFLLTGHLDTVYPAHDAFQQPRWLDDQTLNGPGVADMKGGIAVLIAALEAFEASAAAAAVGYDVLLNSDEETGSLSSAALVARLARGKSAALTYEPAALPEGTLAGARGGSGNYSAVVRGRSAHAGRDPRYGRNAIVAAAALAVALKGLETETLTLNPARIDGGGANNMVPALAILRFNIRPADDGAAAEFQGRLVALVAEVERHHEVSITLHGGISRPPKPLDPGSTRLLGLVRECGAALGQEIGWRPTGGVCDGNNIAACGVPVVDTMGVRGGAIHSPDEYLIVPSLAERAALSAVVLHRLASGFQP